jgi:hypothetical protein
LIYEAADAGWKAILHDSDREGEIEAWVAAQVAAYRAPHLTPAC